jgi:hypothetical protein
MCARHSRRRAAATATQKLSRARRVLQATLSLALSRWYTVQERGSGAAQVNAEPHMGSAYTTIAADVIARFQRLRGRRVTLVTGTDEHGEKIAAAAAAKGQAPKQHCDGIVAAFQDLWRLVRARRRSPSQAALQALCAVRGGRRTAAPDARAPPERITHVGPTPERCARRGEVAALQRLVGRGSEASVGVGRPRLEVCVVEGADAGTQVAVPAAPPRVHRQRVWHGKDCAAGRAKCCCSTQATCAVWGQGPRHECHTSESTSTVYSRACQVHATCHSRSAVQTW